MNQRAAGPVCLGVQGRSARGRDAEKTLDLLQEVLGGEEFRPEAISALAHPLFGLFTLRVRGRRVDACLRALRPERGATGL